MQEPTPDIVVFGARSAAVEAVRAAGFGVRLVAPEPAKRVRKLADSIHELPHSAPPETWRDLARELTPVQPRAVVAATEGSVLAAARLREGLGLSGLGVAAALRCTDKLLMKQAIHAAGLPCAEFVSGDDEPAGADVAQRLGLPFLVKQRIGWGSRGVRWVRETHDIPDRLGRGELAERPVEGVEMSVESYVHQGTPVFVNYTEYLEPFWSNIVPAELPTLLDEAVRDLNREALLALGVERGITHMEVFLTAAGPVFGELAARPPGGRIMSLISRAYDTPAWEDWLALELGDLPSVPREPARFAGVQLLHPGPGVLRRLAGLDAAREVPGVVEAVCRVKPGRAIPVRVGSGQEAGRIVAVGADRESVRAALAKARDHVAFELEQG